MYVVKGGSFALHYSNGCLVKIQFNSTVVFRVQRHLKWPPVPYIQCPTFDQDPQQCAIQGIGCHLGCIEQCIFCIPVCHWRTQNYTHRKKGDIQHRKGFFVICDPFVHLHFSHLADALIQNRRTLLGNTQNSFWFQGELFLVPGRTLFGSRQNSFWFQVELFLVPGRTLFASRQNSFWFQVELFLVPGRAVTVTILPPHRRSRVMKAVKLHVTAYSRQLGFSKF